MRPVTGEPQLAAIVAHGLLNAIAVLSGSAHTVVAYRESLDEKKVDELLSAVASAAELLDSGVEVIGDACPATFRQAAANLTATARGVRAAQDNDRQIVLRQIIDDTAEISAGLVPLVQGLPREVLEFLDSLRRA